MDTQVLPTPTDDELRSWDWVAALARHERGPGWLATRTFRKPRTVRAYRRRERETPIEWLRAAWALLGGPTT